MEYLETFGLALRCYGAFNALHFLSLYYQSLGVIGSKGVTPVALLLNRIRHDIPSWRHRLWQYPSLLWVSSSDVFVLGLTVIGLISSLCVVMGQSSPVALACMAAIQLSFAHTGLKDLNFPGDTLNLELNFLCIYAPPLQPLIPTLPSLRVLILYPSSLKTALDRLRYFFRIDLAASARPSDLCVFMLAVFLARFLLSMVLTWLPHARHRVRYFVSPSMAYHHARYFAWFYFLTAYAITLTYMGWEARAAMLHAPPAAISAGGAGKVTTLVSLVSSFSFDGLHPFSRCLYSAGSFTEWFFSQMPSVLYFAVAWTYVAASLAHAALIDVLPYNSMRLWPFFRSAQLPFLSLFHTLFRFNVIHAYVTLQLHIHACMHLQFTYLSPPYFPIDSLSSMFTFLRIHY